MQNDTRVTARRILAKRIIIYVIAFAVLYCFMYYFAHLDTVLYLPFCRRKYGEITTRNHTKTVCCECAANTNSLCVRAVMSRVRTCFIGTLCLTFPRSLFSTSPSPSPQSHFFFRGPYEYMQLFKSNLVPAFAMIMVAPLFFFDRASAANASATNVSDSSINAEIWAVPDSLLPLRANESLVIHDLNTMANTTTETTKCCVKCSRECCSGLDEDCCGAFVNATLECVCC